MLLPANHICDFNHWLLIGWFPSWLLCKKSKSFLCPIKSIKKYIPLCILGWKPALYLTLCINTDGNVMHRIMYRRRSRIRIRWDWLICNRWRAYLSIKREVQGLGNVFQAEITMDTKFPTSHRTLCTHMTSRRAEWESLPARDVTVQV